MTSGTWGGEAGPTMLASKDPRDTVNAQAEIVASFRTLTSSRLAAVLSINETGLDAVGWCRRFGIDHS